MSDPANNINLRNIVVSDMHFAILSLVILADKKFFTKLKYLFMKVDLQFHQSCLIYYSEDRVTPKFEHVISTLSIDTSIY